MSREEGRGRAVEQLNSLLRGEIAAVQAYDQAIQKVRGHHAAEAAELRRIAQEHGEHAQELRTRVRMLAGDPDDSAGSWGGIAEGVESSPRPLGEASALNALREGEERGQRECRDALSVLDRESRRLVQDVLLPAQLHHIQALDAMIQRIAPPLQAAQRGPRPVV